MVALTSVVLAEPVADLSFGMTSEMSLSGQTGARQESLPVLTRKKKNSKPKSTPAPLERTYVREDYPHLTDAQYANFRNVATPGMGRNALFRSSSPINTKLGRNREADAATCAAGIHTVMNLADSEKKMRKRDGYAGSYYSTLDVIPLNLKVDFFSRDFRNGLAKGFRFIASHEGPYLVHCNEGKERAGFACALLECLMGATADEVVADYMVSFYNYYGVEPGSDQYNAIAKDTVIRYLSAAFHIKGNTTASIDLAACAEEYLRDIGMTDEEIQALKARLERDYL